MKKLLGASATIMITMVVPVIVEIIPMPNNKVHLRANTPVLITGNLTKCTGKLDSMPLDVICNVSGEVTVTPL